MAVIREDLEKTPIYQPIVRRGVFTVPRDMVKRQSRGDRINDLPGLWPFEHFRKFAMVAAKKFVADMASKHMELATPEADLRVYGPYSPKNWVPQGNGNLRPVGKSEHEDLFPAYADFLIIGTFVAKYGKIPRRRCITCKNEVSPELADCPYCGAPMNRDLVTALLGETFNPHDPKL